ncbi:MBL fold metallo-hydrolase [Duganella sp. Root1480D1]|uniref:MBL fold metallo-hydrolase n=1 Tax=Duganella sp. Root1480D1 TaxID=1736471 RepID=UPI0007107ACF|nr:MBL fold metallo-hydrolase [Duganella sp. Root1480D1]KQZ44761.1 MBL fold metallo-hydrolase [Duganella sp. Root1480D1]
MGKHEIIRVSIAPLGMVNCHIVAGANGSVLVDTGLPGSGSKVERALQQHGLRLSDIKLIVVTHAHIDHAGSAAHLRELSGAPIVAHAGDLDYYQQKRQMTFCATGWFGRAFLRTGMIRRPYVPFTPDLLLNDSDVLSLSQFGIDGVVRHTPGHTCGSISVQLSGGDAMVGDLISSGILLGGIAMTGLPKRPPFEDDPHAVAEQLENLLDAGSLRFFMGHGGPLQASEVRSHIASLRATGTKALARTTK